jgi:hypothetical protein
MKNNSRKVYLINPPFQLRIMAWMVGISLAPISIFFMAHHYFFWKLKQLGVEIQLEPDHIYFRFLEGQSHQLLMIFLGCSVLAMVLVAILGLTLSHKIAGPIHRMKRHMTELTQGKTLPQLSFRKNDYFLELPEILNKYINSRKDEK